MKTTIPHQEKKSASRCTGSDRMHQALGTLWTYPVSAHTAPNVKRTGNVNSDAACHGTVCPDADRHGICLPDGAWQGIFLLDAPCQGIFLLEAPCQGIFLLEAPCQGIFLLEAPCQGIFLLDAPCQGIFLLDTPCQSIFLLDAAVLGHFPTGRVRTMYVMAPRSRWLSRCRTSQQILLASHSQTCSGFQA